MTTSPAPVRRNRIDGLRFVAIALVLIEHFGYRTESFLAGYYGVDLFFVISGFLITGILLRTPEEAPGKSLIRFMGRRALRIFPPYYLLILILVACDVYPARQLFVSLVTYTFNYEAILFREQAGENPLFYLWSLSVEEQFYLVWPFLVLGLRKRRLFLLSSITVIVCLSYAQLLGDLVPAMSRFNYTGLFNRMGSLGLGALGAVCVASKPLPAALFLNRWIEAAAFGILAISLTFDIPFRLLIIGVCSLFLVLKAARFEFQARWIDRFVTHPAVVYVGMISYGIYLVHVPLGHALTAHVFDPVWKAIPFGELGSLEKLRWHSWLLKLPLYTGLSIAFAAASHRWFETPVLRLKDRWFPEPLVSSRENRQP